MNDRGELPNATFPAEKTDIAEEPGIHSVSGPDLGNPDEPAADLERLLLSRGEPSHDLTRAAPTNGVVVGTLVALLESRTPMVIYPGQPGTAAVPARTTVALAPNDIGGEVVLQFETGDPQRPIILGRLQSAEAWPLEEQFARVDVDADGKRLVVDAKEQITLRCGKASITLTRDGYVRIRGTSVSSSASGTHRIIGGSVQIN